MAQRADSDAAAAGKELRHRNPAAIVADEKRHEAVQDHQFLVRSPAAVFEPGWVGTATMELSNLGRMAVALYPGMRLCSFTFETVSSPVETPYRLKKGNKDAGQHEPRASMLSEEQSRLTTEPNGARE